MNDFTQIPGQKPGDKISRLIGMDIEEYLTADAKAARAHEAERRDEYVRGFKALMLAPTLPLYQALMRGERVPWNVLNLDQAKRYGLRRSPADGRVSVDDFNDVRT